MGKVLLFGLLWYVVGNPFVAILILLVILYVLDRRFIGLTPSIARPFRLRSRENRLRRELRMNPHDTSAKHELARILLERRRYAAAEPLLRDVLAVKEESADARCELGLALLKTGRPDEGERLLLEALEADPRAKYGEPYLYLGEALADRRPQDAARYMEQFREVHSSSCEGYYRLGQLYRGLNRLVEAKEAYREAVDVYRMLPKYKRRQERRWAFLAWLRSLQG